jgi:hypothetical protein
MKNQRFTLKTGIGFSQRHYSLNKYSLDDFFISLLLFDSPLRRDSFSISYVRFTNDYLQAPASFSYTVTTPKHNFQLATGINLRPNFLVGRKVTVILDSIYKIPQQSDIIVAKKLYTGNASTFCFHH